jgi:tetratricopeptide (TPR) repeat protein
MLERLLTMPFSPEKLDSAISALQQIPENDPDPEQLVNRYMILMRLGQHDKALQCIDRVLEGLSLESEERKNGMQAKAITLASI